jgi:hypothetical protein
MLVTLLTTALAGDVWMVVDTPTLHAELPATWVEADDPALAAEVARVQALPEGASARFTLDPDETVALVHRPVRTPGPRQLAIARGAFELNVALGPGDASLSFDALRIDVDGLTVAPDPASGWAPVLRAAPTVLLAGKGPRPVRVELR